ncbi:SusC/RagA family TonB-linked outer membrane protein [Terrimonas pollutisoli]|uniref:SusC/RagA family TonB-linked outer membrane protein n=1 Tax=Terrimonas pollutisoli TaxID=3034147 RepID=UPI0023ED3479|nr:SusC/RagA family TonB-linked outer membrane protein [Terrimonas sp. H1YJ31]
MRKLLTMFPLLLLCCNLLLAQQKQFTGKITDKNGQPIPNASIRIKGTNQGTTAGADGSFIINANPGDVIEISGVGLGVISQKLGTTTDLGALTMDLKETALDEVVVTAFGIKREKKALGYAVQEVKGDDLTIAKATDVSSSLAGKVAGVKLIGSPSSTFDNADVIIRGVTGLGLNPPIFVVDGTVTDQSAVIMDNVESLSVLKGPAATALYGQRAANGVVVITTKKGSRRKSSSIEVNLGVTTESLSIIPPYQNEYAGGYTSAAATKGSIYDDQGYYLFKYNDTRHPIEWKAFDGQRMLEYGADESWGPKIDGSMYRPYYSWYPGADWAKLVPLTPQPDNVKDFFQAGRNLNNSVALSSGAENYNFRLTYANQNRTLIIPGAKRDQHQLGINGSFDISNRITISSDVSYTTRYTKGQPLEGYRLDGLNVTQNFNQWFQRQLDMKKMKQYRNEDGSLNSWNIGDPNGSSDLSVYGQPQYWDNPYFVIKENFGTQKHSRIVGNVGLTIKITKNLSLQSYARMNQYSNENDYRIATGGLQQDGYEITQNQFKEMNYETNLLYKNRFGDFSVDGMVGANRRQDFFSQLYMATQGGLSSPNYFDISASVARPITTHPTIPGYQKKRVNSVYGKASFGFRDMIFVEGTLRNDWSSALPASKNSYIYPSISTSFIFTELLKSSSTSSWLTYGKVRASYASVGSDIAPHSLDIALNNGSFYGSNSSVAVGNQFRDAENLRPALTKAWEVGTELRLFNRVGIDVALYENNNTDQIIPLDVSSASGFSTALVNAGNIVSKGVEITLSGTPIKGGSFTWDITANWSKNSNKVKELVPGLNTYLYATNRYDTRLEHQVGGEWGTYVGRKWRTDDQGRVLINYAKNATTGIESSTGLPEYDINQKIGQVLPEWTGGLFNTLRYKAFDLAFSIDFQKGGLFYSETRNFNSGTGLSEETVGVNDKGHDWRDYPGTYTFAGGNTGNGGIRIDGVFNDGKGTPNNRYLPARSFWYTARQRDAREVLLDASYVKLREVRLGYTFPQSFVAKTKIAKSANFGIMVQNAWLIWATTKKYGVDPSELEVFYREGGQLSATRQIGANLRVTF